MSASPPFPEPPPSATVEPEAPPEPTRRSRRPLLAAAAVLIALVAGVVAVAVWVSAPGRCDEATFTSTRLGYCLVAPSGWAGGTARVGSTTVDELLLPKGSAAVFIQAVSLQPGAGLEEFATQVRALDQQAGYRIGKSSTSEVDGVTADRWDVTSTAPNGDVTKVREVVFVRSGTGWRVELADTADAFDRDAAALEQMLSSWRFT